MRDCEVIFSDVMDEVVTLTEGVVIAEIKKHYPDYLTALKTIVLDQTSRVNPATLDRTVLIFMVKTCT